jgi:hypothetical protein
MRFANIGVNIFPAFSHSVVRMSWMPISAAIVAAIGNPLDYLFVP